jgi:hypothetical protein
MALKVRTMVLGVKVVNFGKEEAPACCFGPFDLDL